MHSATLSSKVASTGLELPAGFERSGSFGASPRRLTPSSGLPCGGPGPPAGEVGVAGWGTGAART
eukprot:1802498-Lingulodinium_polyedra.AAC.1